MWIRSVWIRFAIESWILEKW